MHKDKSGPVYPCLERGGNGLDLTHPGMTLRQWYAGLAMQGMLSSGLLTTVVEGGVRPFNETEISDQAFAMADAMIAEGGK